MSSSHSDSELIKVFAKNKVKRNNLHVPFKSKNKSFKTPIVLIKAIKEDLLLELQEERLLLAVSTNNVEMVQKYLASGVSANSTDRQSRSALHLAASRGYADIVRLLLEYGADPNKQDIVRNTPLHLAACTNNLSVITLLLKAGADISCLDIHGRNPLQLAKSKLEILQRSWKEGAIEMINLRSQLQQVVDMMISLWERKKRDCIWSQHRDNIDDLQLMKLSLSCGPEQDVDDQMSKLMMELQEFSIK